MNQRYDLLAFSLLVFSIVVVIALALDPTGFAPSKWQTVIASMIALGAASLAYRAAMTKVDFDRAIELRDQRGKTLGLCLRLDFTLRVLAHEALVLTNSIPEGTNFDLKKTVQSKWFEISESATLLEAWENLDRLPPWVADRLALIRSSLYDLGVARRICGDVAWELQFGKPVPQELLQIRTTSAALHTYSQEVRTALSPIIKSLR